MKLILFCVFFVYAYCHDAEPPTETLKLYWNSAMERALKRKFGEGYTASPEDECSKACQKPPPGGFGQHLVMFANPGPDAIKGFYNKEFLSKVCGFVNSTAACVRACPDTQRRQYLRSIFAPVKFLCEDSRIVQNADCLGQVSSEEGLRCIAGQCSDKKTAFEQAVNSYKTAQPQTKELAERALEKMCELFDCGALCSSEARQSRCGNEVEADVRQFYNVLGQSLSDIRYLSPDNFVVDIPPVCVHAI